MLTAAKKFTFSILLSFSELISIFWAIFPILTWLDEYACWQVACLAQSTAQISIVAHFRGLVENHIIFLGLALQCVQRSFLGLKKDQQA